MPAAATPAAASKCSPAATPISGPLDASGRQAAPWAATSPFAPVAGRRDADDQQPGRRQHARVLQPRERLRRSRAGRLEGLQRHPERDFDSSPPARRRVTSSDGARAADRAGLAQRLGPPPPADGHNRFLYPARRTPVISGSVLPSRRRSPSAPARRKGRPIRPAWCRARLRQWRDRIPRNLRPRRHPAPELQWLFAFCASWRTATTG